MAGMSDTFENDIMKLIFNGTAIANVADNAATSPLTNLFVSLHTTTLDDTSVQTTNEVSYTGYARAQVLRTSGGWTITGNSVSPTTTISFGPCTAGSTSALWAAIGTSLTGTGKILFYGQLSSSISISVGVTPQITTTTTITID